MSENCVPEDNPFNALLTLVLCVGCLSSYVPQFYRIIKNGSSEGFSPWYLFFGSTGTAAGFLNILTLQWPVVLCCPVWSFGTCIEGIAGIFQLGLMWFLFTTINILYIIYYPVERKYQSETEALEHFVTPEALPLLVKQAKKSEQWRVSVRLFQVVIVHFLLCLSITIYVLSSSTYAPTRVEAWATFLGVSAALLTIIQYVPQLVHTYQAKVVGAISIPMLAIQLSGAPLIIASISLRQGTTWTSWLPFAVSGTMQTCLLIMCILWKARQARLGIDDFGNLLGEGAGRVPVVSLIVGDRE